MDEVESYRRRLAALSADRASIGAGTPAPSLAEVRAAQGRLRRLKRDVLARVEGLRDEVQRQARAPRKGRPTMGEAWSRRREGAKKLLADVQRRVIGLVDREHGQAIESLSEINGEIDTRLEDLDMLESRLAGQVGGDAGLETSPGSAENEAAGDDDDDDLYAAVGAAVRKGGERRRPLPALRQGARARRSLLPSLRPSTGIVPALCCGS